MIGEALSYVDPHDRDTWVRMAMAIKSELGDTGFSIWNDWSQQASNYNAAAAKSVWRSVCAGDISIATLYYEAKEQGWVRSRGASRRPPVSRPTVMDDSAERHRAAAEKARAMVEAAHLAPHDYLGRKGFSTLMGLCLDTYLIVPMRDSRTGAMRSIQTIARDGRKKFLKGGKASGSVFALGSGAETWLVEGYATGLSVREALRRSYSGARVLVCFSAANLTKVTGHYVIADHDVSQTGERYAIKTGLPWWMPPVPGDANDFHKSQGLDALADELNRLRRDSS